MPVKVNKEKEDKIKKEKLNDEIESLCSLVSSERIMRLSLGFEYNGTLYPMDVEAQGVYTALANAIIAGIQHSNIIRTMDNRVVTVSDDEMSGIGTACLMAAGAINIAAWNAKDNIRKCKSIEDAKVIYDEYMDVK